MEKKRLMVDGHEAKSEEQGAWSKEPRARSVELRAVLGALCSVPKSSERRAESGNLSRSATICRLCLPMLLPSIEKLDLIFHFLSGLCGNQPLEPAQTLADRISLLGRQNDAGVRLSLGQILRVDSLEVSDVEAEQHTSVGPGELQLFLVVAVGHPYFQRGCRVDPSRTQS